MCHQPDRAPGRRRRGGAPRGGRPSPGRRAARAPQAPPPPLPWAAAAGLDCGRPAPREANPFQPHRPRCPGPRAAVRGATARPGPPPAAAALLRAAAPKLDAHTLHKGLTSSVPLSVFPVTTGRDAVGDRERTLHGARLPATPAARSAAARARPGACPSRLLPRPRDDTPTHRAFVSSGSRPAGPPSSPSAPAPLVPRPRPWPHLCVPNASERCVTSYFLS
jgi:hypothetical protein